MADDYDAAVSAALAGPPPTDPAQAARVGMQQAVGTSPDLQVELQRVAEKTGVPISSVAANPEGAKRAAALGSIDFDSLAAAAPSTARLLADIEKAKVVHDDVGGLSEIEKAVRSFVNPGWQPQYVDGRPRVLRSPQFGALVAEIKAKNPSIGFDEARAVAAQIASVDNQSPFIQNSQGPQPSVGSIATGLATSFTSGFEQVRQGIRMQIDDALGLDNTDALTKFNRAGNQIALTTPNFESSTAKGLYSGGVSLLQNAPGVAASIMLGNPAPALAIMGGQVEAQSYGKYRARGATAGQAFIGGMGEGALEVATEAMPMSFLVNKLGKAGAGEFLTGLLAREIPSEQLATLTQDAVDTAIANPDKTWAQYAAERPGAAYETLLAVLVQSGVMTGAHSALQRTVMAGQAQEYQAKQAEQSAQVLQQIMQFSAASKVRERDPATFAGFMQDATADGPLEKVYVNPKELEAAGLNLAQLAEVAPSAVDALTQAYKTGTDAAIPTAELATLLPGNALEQSLLPHLKTDPEGFSQASAATYMQTQGEEVRATVEKVLSEKHLDDTFKQSMATVEANVLAQLKEANRFTDVVNAPYAAMWSAFFGVQAARLGTMPEQLFQQYAPRIVAQGAGALQQGGPSLADVRAQWDAAGLSHTISEKDNVITVSKIVVPEAERGTGKGSAAMKALIEYADATGKHIALSPSGDFGGNKARLVKFYKGLGFVENKGKNRAFTTSESMYRLAPGKALEQSAPAGPRGSFNPDSNTIAILQAADLSTFLHESGHFFLGVLANLASQPNAPAQIVDDFNTFLKWTGVEGGTEAWNAMTLDQQREHHENFARGFEAYLFEGKAPNIELQGIFQRFRAWLLNVYNAITALHINLTPEVRGVFDRMLATTDQIKLAEDVRGYEALFKNKPEGMTADEWSVYQIQANEATQDAITELEARSLRDMKWLANAKSRELAKLQKEAKARRDEIERRVRAEVDATPVYAVLADIKEQRKSDPAEREAVRTWTAARASEQARLSDVIKGEYLATAEGAATKGIERGQYLARNKRAMANEVEKMVLQWEKNNPKPKVTIPDADLEALAVVHGFSSGDELRKAIDSAQPRGDVIEGMTDQRMLEQHGDLIDQQDIERAAEKAIHNEARLRFTATELNALNKATGKPAILAKAVRLFAADIIARARVRDLNPSIYTAAEKRAALDAAKAAKAGKLEDAAIQKRNQLINGYAAREALTARDQEIPAVVEYLKKFNRESIYKTLDGDYVEQIHNLLERFDLRTGQSLTAIDKRTSLTKWLAAQEEAGFEPDIPQDIADEAVRKSYKNMTVEELRGLRDTVKQIEHLGRLKHKLLTAKDQRDYESVRDLIVASIAEHANGKSADNRTRPTALNAALRMFNGYLLEHRKVASLARELDGFKDGGAMWEYIVRGMNHAGDTEATMRADAATKLAALVKPLLEGGKRGGKGEFFPAVGKSFNREERLGIALNMGNEGNLQRLLDGEGWTLAQVKTITDTLTAADWTFVQGVWNFLESFRPLVGAKEKRVYGKEPNWVEPMPLKVQTADGKTLDLAGGYYPIKYDTAQSGRAETLADAEAAKQMLRGAFTSATTRRSFTKTRSEEIKGRPLLYSTDALFNGVNEIIHDLTWHEWLIDANRLLRSKSIDGAIRTAYGAQVMQQFKSAIKDIAAGEFPATHAFERGLGQLRAGTVIAGLGLNLMNSVINVQGFTQSIVRVGVKWSAVGLAKYATGPLSLSREVAAKSQFMAARAMTLNREVNEIQSLVRDKSTLRQATDRMMFLPLTITQNVVDTPTWWGAYQKALDQSNDEDRAVSLADQAVVDAQSGGQIKDLAGIQRGGPYLKLWTTFYGFFSSTYNLTVESTKATKFTNPLAVAKLATDYLLLWTIPALLGTLLKNVMVGGDWDEEKLAKKAINDQVGYLLGTMVGLREFAGAVQAAAGTSEFNTGYGGPAGARFMGEMFKLAQQAHQGDIDAAFLKALDNVFGILFRLPSGQVNRTVEGVIALKEGQTTNPLAVLAGPPPKQ